MRRIVLIALITTAGFPAISLAQPPAKGHTVRWDLSQVIQNTALADGADVATDAPTGDTFTLTGSGADPMTGTKSSMKFTFTNEGAKHAMIMMQSTNAQGQTMAFGNDDCKK